MPWVNELGGGAATGRSDGGQRQLVSRRIAPMPLGRTPLMAPMPLGRTPLMGEDIQLKACVDAALAAAAAAVAAARAYSEPAALTAYSEP